MGCIEVVCGSMFSGKTEELLRRLKRARLARQQVQLFKPRLDDRYDAVKVVSHEGMNGRRRPRGERRRDPRTDALGRRRGRDRRGAVLRRGGSSPVAQTLADRGVRVIAAGLDQDYRGEPFGPIAPLLGDRGVRDEAPCRVRVCGAHASRSQRLVASEGQLFVGGAAAYEARCRGVLRPGRGRSQALSRQRPSGSGVRP